jgi:deoxyadenosine/deoxycytidine kinase
MGKLILVVGSTSVGKTALVRALCKQGPFVAGLEEHNERPFQRVLKPILVTPFANRQNSPQA